MLAPLWRICAPYYTESWIRPWTDWKVTTTEIHKCIRKWCMNVLDVMWQSQEICAHFSVLSWGPRVIKPEACCNGVFTLPDSDSYADSETNSYGTGCGIIVFLKRVYSGPMPIPIPIPILMQMATVPNLTQISVLIRWLFK